MRLCVSVILALVRLENVGSNRTVDANMRRRRHNTWHTHIEYVKVVVAYWKVKTPCHAHGECIN